MEEERGFGKAPSRWKDKATPHFKWVICHGFLIFIAIYGTNVGWEFYQKL